MDKMATGWDRPQEDEFAMCLLGQPSPYRKLAFPNEPIDAGVSNPHNLSPTGFRQWKAAFLQFIRQVTLANGGRRLILKSPSHTWRIPTLLNLFPNARFVHIVRNPYVVYPSTLNLWKSLYVNQGLQLPTFAGLADTVLDTFVDMHSRLDEARKVIPCGQFCELRYEDLLADPIAQLDSIYSDLELGDFELAREAAEAYLAGTKNYETNRYELSAGERETITDRWGPIIRKYGYDISAGKQLSEA